MTKIFLLTEKDADHNSAESELQQHLNSLGREQAAQAAAILPHLHCIFTSSYRSAVETTYIIAATLGVKWKSLPAHVPVLLQKSSLQEKVLWDKKVTSFFTFRDTIELGQDTAAAMKDLITSSLESALKDVPAEKNTAVVASSFELALYAEEFSSRDAESLWESLESGEILAVNLDTGELEESRTSCAK